jgi:hypothetical protein
MLRGQVGLQFTLSLLSSMVPGTTYVVTSSIESTLREKEYLRGSTCTVLVERVPNMSCAVYSYVLRSTVQVVDILFFQMCHFYSWPPQQQTRDACHFTSRETYQYGVEDHKFERLDEPSKAITTK